MSTFDGFITEIPGISVDRFELSNLNSSVFFLSHCHTDHMHGLSTTYLRQNLKRDNVTIYASPISVLILSNLYPDISSKLKNIEINTPILIKIPEKEENYITVTSIPAGHCPGSVMFLFETNEKNILYTGDFRLNPSDLIKFKGFFETPGQIIKIDKVYLDTTFFNKSYEYFPPRDECVEIICRLINEWISLSKKHCVKIQNSANYGSEYLFIEIYKKVKMPIHVRDEVYKNYICIPEMENIVTLNEKMTQIHSSCIKHGKICKDDLVRIIIPTAFFWTKIHSKEKCIENKGKYRVCYSCHSSYSEIIEFLDFIQPKEIYPCVIPETNAEQEILYELIKETLKKYSSIELHEEKLFCIKTQEKQESSLLEFRQQSPLKDKFKFYHTEKYFDDLLASPPSKKKGLFLNEKESSDEDFLEKMCNNFNDLHKTCNSNKKDLTTVKQIDTTSLSDDDIIHDLFNLRKSK